MFISKTISVLVLGSLAIAGWFSAGITAQGVEISISLQKAVELGIVQLESTGGFLGEKVSFIADNRTSKSYKVTIPRGTILLNKKAPSEQNMMVTRTVQFIVPAGQTVRGGIWVACFDATRGPPSAGTVLDVATFNVGPQLLRLLDVIDKRELWASLDAQRAIWNVTDNVTVSGIAVDLLREASIDPNVPKQYPHWSDWPGKSSLTSMVTTPEPPIIVQDCFFIADAGVNRTVKEGEIVRFRALGAPGNFSPAGLPLFFFWDFGDGSKAKGKKVSHVYADNGSFTVTLTVSDGRGCIVQDTAEITVENVAPIVKSDGPILKARVGQPVHFFGRFGDPGRADTHTVEWDFGDGTIETFTLPADPWLTSPLTATHTYDAPGVYKVTLTVTDDDGDSDSATFEVRVFSNEARRLANENGFGFISFSVEDSGIKSIEIEIWDLSGRRVFKSGEVLGNTLEWRLQNDKGERLANGVYLYVLTVRRFDGSVLRHAVRKLVVLR